MFQLRRLKRKGSERRKIKTTINLETNKYRKMNSKKVLRRNNP